VIGREPPDRSSPELAAAQARWLRALADRIERGETTDEDEALIDHLEAFLEAPGARPRAR
jgi:hypothetical protein